MVGLNLNSDPISQTSNPIYYVNIRKAGLRFSQKVPT